MYSIILSTCSGEKEANKIARKLVEKKLAACVSIVKKVRSFYRWKGKVVKDEECMLVIKTRKARVDNVFLLIKKMHSYDVPEMVEINVDSGDRKYLDWISEATR